MQNPLDDGGVDLELVADRGQGDVDDAGDPPANVQFQLFTAL